MRRAPVWACVLALAGAAATAAPGAPPDRGVGPVSEVKLGPLDAAKARRGREVFEQKCSACHKFDERYVGPPLGGVTRRRTPEWIMNMILAPQKMTAENEEARRLLAEYMTQMTYQNVSEADARAILEFFREHDAAAPAGGGATAPPAPPPRK